MRSRSGKNLRSALFAGVAMLLAECNAVPDPRLAEDQQSCQGMGHAVGTASFRQCLVDLNERRCPLATAKGSLPHHVASMDCTRLN